MPLPTIQPFDYPDWGQPGTLTAANYNVAAVAGIGIPYVELDVGYYNHTLLIFDGNGDGESYTAALKWYTANPLEGGSLQIIQTVTVATGTVVVVPVTNPTTFLIIEDVAATNYPHNVLMTVTQFAAWGSMVGYPGGENVLTVGTGTSGAETLVWSPTGCAPGRHSLRIMSEAPTWSLSLRTWPDCNNTVDFPLADETVTGPIEVEWIAPASSWQLVYDTAEAGDHLVWAFVNRLPT